MGTENTVRRPPGIQEAVEIRADDETLATFLDLKSEYGNIVSMKSPRGRDVYFVNEPAAIQRILVRDHDKYVKGPGFERVKLLLGNGIFVSNGAHWRRARRMAQPGFTRRKLRSLIELIVDRVETRALKWQAQSRAGHAIDITTEMNDFALELILRAIFGPDYDARIVADGENPFAFLAEEFSRDINLVIKFRALRQLILEIIAGRRGRANPEAVDFLSVYMSATDKHGQPFSDRDLLDEVMTLIVAGFETSAGTLNWAWYLIASHPDIADRIVQEARENGVRVDWGQSPGLANRASCGKPDKGDCPQSTLTPFSNEQLNGLVYLEQVINETMRLYPPGWIFSRRAIEDTDIGDYDVPAGTDIYVSPYVLHRSAEFWPDPDRFDPDRFAVENFTEAQQAAFIPFSLGPRRCIGEYFAMLEMKVHLALLLPRFDMTPVSDEVPPLDLGINLRSQGSIYLRTRERSGA